MKTIFYKFLFICMTSILFCDCKKEKSPSEIILEYPILFPQNMEIDTLNVDSLIVRESYEFPANLDGELAKNNTSKSKIKSAKLIFPGLDKDGIPTGFTVATDNGTPGTLRVNRNTPVATEAGTELTTQAITAVGGPNVMISQNITVDGNGTTYSVTGVSAGVAGSWTPLELGATTADFERMSNGQYLVTVRILVVSTPTSEFSIPVGNRGFDLTGPIKSVTTRLVLNAGKTQILAQSVLVTESKK